MQILEDLVMIPSPSGFEKDIAGYIMGCLKGLPVTITKDRQHNVSVVVPGKTDTVVLIDAHMDQLGFIVTHVDKSGFLSISQLGYGDVQLASARNLIILGDKGPVNATVNRQHSHLVVDEDEEALCRTQDALVDTGSRKISEIRKHVSVGDPVVYPLSFNKMLGNTYSACGMDDKAGCWILMEVIKKLSKAKVKPVPTLVFTFSAQEETCSKWGPLIRRHKPALFIEVDVTFATDWSYDDELKYVSGKCSLGAGPVLYRGLGIDEQYRRLIKTVAKENKVKTQIMAINEGNPDISNAREGTTFLNIGIPLRNMHTPVETINAHDLSQTVKLLYKFLLTRKILAV